MKQFLSGSCDWTLLWEIHAAICAVSWIRMERSWPLLRRFTSIRLKLCPSPFRRCPSVFAVYLTFLTNCKAFLSATHLVLKGTVVAIRLHSRTKINTFTVCRGINGQYDCNLSSFPGASCSTYEATATKTYYDAQVLS